MASAVTLVRAACFITPRIDPSTNSASTLINKLVKAATDGQGAEAQEVTLRLKVEDGTPLGKYIEGKCLLTSASMQMAVGESVVSRGFV